MGQVDCWPMQCPPMLPTGVINCRDTAAPTFADYNNPVTDCCVPRCTSKAVSSASSGTTATTAMAAVDPCLQQLQQLDDHRHHSGEINDNSDDRDDEGDNDSRPNYGEKRNNNDTTAPSAAGQPCFYGERAYQSGARWKDPVDMCTSCDCKVKLTATPFLVIKPIYIKY